MWLFSMFSVPRTADAEAELRAELQEFAYDGLTQLHSDLTSNAVKRGTWDGCVLSYRLGGPGSASCDRRGRRGNAFTRFWDTERISTATVLRLIEEEKKSREHVNVPAASPLVAN
jgi:hypothetical protein